MTVNLLTWRLSKLSRIGCESYKIVVSVRRQYATLVEALKSGARLTPSSCSARNKLPDGSSTTATKIAQSFPLNKRSAYKQRSKLAGELTPNIWAYATAEQYDFEAVRKYFTTLGNERYELKAVNGAEFSDSVLRLIDKGVDVCYYFQGPRDHKEVENEGHISPSFDNEVLLFREGVAVMWNLGQSERTKLLSLLAPFQIGSLDHSLVQDEAEKLTYVLDEQVDSTHFKQHEVLHIKAWPYTSEFEKKIDIEVAFLEKYAISDAMARSVKLKKRVIDERSVSYHTVVVTLKGRNSDRLEGNVSGEFNMRRNNCHEYINDLLVYMM